MSKRIISQDTRDAQRALSFDGNDATGKDGDGDGDGDGDRRDREREEGEREMDRRVEMEERQDRVMESIMEGDRELLEALKRRVAEGSAEVCVFT